MQSRFNRRKSRAIAMEIIYSDTVNVREDEITDEFLQDFAHITDTREQLDLAYIRQTVQLAKDQDGYIRQVIRPHLKDWTLERVSKVNQAILKIAVTEILFMDDIPDRVSLNEALELSKIYSDEESTAFVNGVLDKILKAKIAGTILPQEDETGEASGEASGEVTAAPEGAGDLQAEPARIAPEEPAQEVTEETVPASAAQPESESTVPAEPPADDDQEGTDPAESSEDPQPPIGDETE